jgi:two-component system chemotaxis response regulator CheY
LFIISTEGSERDREKGLALGADAYLVKPFTPDELQSLIKKYL